MWIWLVSAFLFTGCIKRNRLPCWVNQPCKPYKSDLYILGVGKGQNKNMAADEAIASLSNRFQLKQSEDENAPPKMLASFIAMELNGIKIVERYQRNGVFYALAALERFPLLTQLDKEIGKLQKESKELTKMAKKSSSKIDKAHLYHQAIPLLEKIELLNEQRQIVDFENKSLKVYSTSRKVRDLKNKSLTSINISITADPTAEPILPTLRNIFIKQGFKTDGTRTDLKLVISGMEGLHPTDKKGFKKLRYQIQFNIKEPGKKNRILLLRNFVDEGLSQNLYESQTQAINGVKESLIRARIGKQLKNTILGERP